MFKRVLSFLAVLTLLFGCAAAEAPGATYSDTHRIEMREYPFYYITSQVFFPNCNSVPVYFVDGIEDLPFLNVPDLVKIMNSLYTQLYGSQDSSPDFDYIIDVGANQCIIRRGNNSVMICDFKSNVITWTDYDTFLHHYLNFVTLPETDANGQPYLLQLVRSNDRHGESVLINLSDYEIPMIAQDGKYLIPLQTLSAFCFSDIGSRMYFNGQCLIFANVSTMKQPNDELENALSPYFADSLIEEAHAKYHTDSEVRIYLINETLKTEIGQTIYQRFQSEYNQSAYKLFLSGQSGVRSHELAQFGYHELCLELDSFYGSKNMHGIESFDSLLSQNGLKEAFLSTDALIADAALKQLLQLWLDDGHSNMISTSSATTPSQIESFNLIGRTAQIFAENRQKIAAIHVAHPESQQGYYEVGNTAYVTLDDFSIDKKFDYYSFLQSCNDPFDTASLIAYAHQQITRENSPIENVVLDLSNNDGGDINAATYVISWFLGDAHISLENMFTGTQSTATYRADVNLDHKFDESDTVSHLNLYCLISPLSFSCGNLVPWAFKADGRVTLIGKTSGGGSCLVAFSNTAWGTSYQYSGQMRVSFVKNGSFYDVDQGVVPDYFIRTYDHFYDREALTEFINSLY